ncbi:MAG TPA: hypothetical protein VF669_07955 [Tepidisphaeraceae bacterium]
MIRRLRGWGEGMFRYDVYLNGKLLASLKAGEERVFRLKVGKHELRARSGLSRSQVFPIHVRGDRPVAVVMGANPKSADVLSVLMDWCFGLSNSIFIRQVSARTVPPGPRGFAVIVEARRRGK